MTRKKVSLAYITNDSERKASYKKRKKGLVKKVSELATLCGVDVCCIINSQYDAEPEVWPSRTDAQAILARFRELSEMEQGRKMENQESFTRQRIKKAADQLRRLQRENKCRELECYMHQCIAGNITLGDARLPDSAEMNWVINQTLRNIQARQDDLMAEFQRRQAMLPPPLPQMPPPPPPMEKDNLESFPWNLLQSPTGGGAAGLEEGEFGWNPGMVQPYSHFNPSPSDQQGNQGNSSNNFN